MIEGSTQFMVGEAINRIRQVQQFQLDGIFGNDRSR
jgi:hypothetical protein